ncbi:3-oxoacyl-(acyl-carrier-protein) reductase [Sphingobium chlorophenolicum L-1]|uniref:3-oxoacyl-(Acyl-carrier-protein) reductase n=1 Tax=Sphingobium chlorophenolicum L-1 TaxID=690566 RepID=F6F3D0_SPHCR|nr:SDR family oxidoreductase [Sphingobium chlorophenolicum]AEG50942.1 3-oxoacyl-(acyl-carrier-protein) reductase [Sphingobium chlorophenolicum L-1]
MMAILDDIFSLKGKAAVVTGAASGFGRAFAVAMAEAGADLALIDTNPQGLKQTVELVRERGRVAHIHVADVSDEAAICAAFKGIDESFGRIDILVNNAGIGERFRGKIHEYPSADWKRIVDVNLNGVFYCSREALRRMYAQQSGKIINLASIWGMVGGGFLNAGGYATTKGGVVNLTREMALEYAPHNIQINAICPGFHRTSIMDFGDPQSQGIVELMKAHTPAGRLAGAEELRGTLLYLASSASNFMSGSIIAVDGGFLAR